MLVPHIYVVPWTSDWPEDMWDVKLGGRVYSIRKGQDHKEHRKELSELGFQYEKQVVGRQGDWETVKSAFLTYKLLNNGSMEIPFKFVVPSENSNWPDNTWGVKLGNIVNRIRNRNDYKIHRSELEEMGFRYNRVPSNPFLNKFLYSKSNKIDMRMIRKTISYLISGKQL